LAATCYRSGDSDALRQKKKREKEKNKRKKKKKKKTKNKKKGLLSARSRFYPTPGGQKRLPNLEIDQNRDGQAAGSSTSACFHVTCSVLSSLAQLRPAGML